MALALTPRFVRFVGDGTLRLLSYSTQIATVAGYGVYRLTFGIGRLSRVRRDVVLRQILFTGVEALWFTGLIATLTGLVVVVQAQLQLGTVVEAGRLGKLLVVVIVRELGPLIGALIILLRSGTAITTETGIMRVSGEIDSLEFMGIDPFEYLVVPRLAGVTVSLFCVTLFFVFVSLASGFVFYQMISPRAPTLNAFVLMIAQNLAFKDVLVFVAKTVVPGLMIATINCVEGLSAGPESTDVPRAATRGVVYAISAVFVWNALITALAFIT